MHPRLGLARRVEDGRQIKADPRSVRKERRKPGLRVQLAGLERATVEYYRPPRLTLWSLLGLVDAAKARISGLSAEDMVLLEILNHN